MQTTATNLADPSRERKPPCSNRRRSVRHKVHIPAYAAFNNAFGDSPAMELQEIINISEDGLAIQVSTPLEEPRVNLCLDLTETGTLIEVKGSVVWQDSCRAGVRFAELAADSRQKLKEWLFANAMAACEYYAAGPSSAESFAFSAIPGPSPEPAAAQPVGASVFPPDFTATLVALQAVRREVAAAHGMDQALQLIADRALTLTRATGAAIALREENDLVCRASSGSDAPPVGVRFKAGEGFSGACIGSGQTLRCDDSETDPRVDKLTCRALGVRAMLATPIRGQDSIVGLIEVFSPLPNAFHTQDESCLDRVAKLVADKILPPTTVRQPISSDVSPVHTSTMQNLERETSSGETCSETEAVPQSTSSVPISPEPEKIWAATSTILSDNVGYESAEEPAAGRSSVTRILLLSLAALALIAAGIWLFAPFNLASRRSLPHVQVQAAVQPSARKPSPIVAPPDFKSLRQQAEKGDPVAQFAVGAHYATGEDVPQDYSEALKWFTKAAEQGHVGAQSTLGAYYWSGRGAPQDLSKAYFWAVLAQSGGDDASRYRVEFLASRMTHAQIVAAQQQADQWIKSHEAATTSSAAQPK
jgi:putative methionine-R-sulfoxide reductase with GAF domain